VVFSHLADRGLTADRANTSLEGPARDAELMADLNIVAMVICMIINSSEISVI